MSPPRRIGMCARARALSPSMLEPISIRSNRSAAGIFRPGLNGVVNTPEHRAASRAPAATRFPASSVGVSAGRAVNGFFCDVAMSYNFLRVQTATCFSRKTKVRLTKNKEGCDLGLAAGARLADRMRRRTRLLHREAERSGVIRRILSGCVSLDAYAVFLRNLLPAYWQLETGLDYHRRSQGIRLIAQPVVYRAEALESDLREIVGTAWRDRIPLLPAGDAYRRRIAEAATGHGEYLIAHAYTRYLGDLNGGQVLKRRLGDVLKFGPESLSFYEFADVTDIATARAQYRAAIDRSEDEIRDAAGVVEEAARSFANNIAISVAVERATESIQSDRDRL